jgi:hypothetical protein
MSRPSPDQLKRALKISEQIAKLEAELASILGNTSAAPRVKRAYTKRAISDVAAPAKKKRKKSKISAEGKERIAAAQRARWAKIKKEKAKKE